MSRLCEGEYRRRGTCREGGLAGREREVAQALVSPREESRVAVLKSRLRGHLAKVGGSVTLSAGLVKAKGGQVVPVLPYAPQQPFSGSPDHYILAPKSAVAAAQLRGRWVPIISVGCCMSPK